MHSGGVACGAASAGKGHFGATSGGWFRGPVNAGLDAPCVFCQGQSRWAADLEDLALLDGSRVDDHELLPVALEAVQGAIHREVLGINRKCEVAVERLQSGGEPGGGLLQGELGRALHTDDRQPVVHVHGNLVGEQWTGACDFDAVRPGVLSVYPGWRQGSNRKSATHQSTRKGGREGGREGTSSSPRSLDSG